MNVIHYKMVQKMVFFLNKEIAMEFLQKFQSFGMIDLIKLSVF